VFTPARFPTYSRRRFLRELLGAGALTVTGLDSLLAQTGTVLYPDAKPFRFAFLTDLHLMKDGGLRSAEGIAACLGAVEKLDPRPDFILVGGDLVHDARHLTVVEAETRLDFFLKIWKENTALPAHWTFGNHDLVATANPDVLPGDKHYGKGLFQDRFQLPHLFHSFDHQGWHFVILDDIAPQPDRSYIGEFFDDELLFLQADLDANRTKPTIVCCHIPTVSNLPVGLALAHAANQPPGAPPKNLVCENGSALLNDFPGHHVRAVLSGHLHYYEPIELNGVRFVNSGAVCGSYWKGPLLDCQPGFGVVDLGADGSVKFEYRDYGWKV